MYYDFFVQNVVLFIDLSLYFLIMVWRKNVQYDFLCKINYAHQFDPFLHAEVWNELSGKLFILACFYEHISRKDLHTHS